MTHYLFGYGSLIDSASRDKTGETGQSLPVQVSGFERAWNVVAAKGGYMAVGITPSQNAWCNGVIVEVGVEELPKFDIRERLYHRVVIPHHAVTMLSGEILPAGSIWTYVVSQPGYPSESCPLIQSYIDVILTGCLAISPDFAATFIDTTIGWHPAWLEDRARPRYPRAMSDVSASEIDALLQARLPDAFRQRRRIK